MTESREILEKLGVGHIGRHLFLCAGPKCCQEEDGQKAWEALKGEIARNGLGQGESVCFRTRAGCLRLCQQGPVAVVYPEGTWYGEVTADRIPRLVREHLMEGRPVYEWVLAKNPLPGSPDGVTG